MRKKEFELRPKAEMVLNAWYSIRGKLNEDVIEEQPLRFREGVKPRYTSTPPPTTATYCSRGRGASGSHPRPENESGSGSKGHHRPNSRPMIGGYPGPGAGPSATSASYSGSSGHSSTNGQSVSNEQPSSTGHPSSISHRPHLSIGHPAAGLSSGRPRV